jgi:hypothetical protein
VLALLAGRGQHRAPSIPDLIMAATAELAGLTVLHLDKDFEVIADVTGQPVERPQRQLSPQARSGTDGLGFDAVGSARPRFTRAMRRIRTACYAR